ncbi:conserved hypothetical protein [Neospora caninum Liverpool]|uniref:Uncharacterized protein n=1 Tax=Neospora caninum (strain Liverpool) TaxID=572307 RepID=F0VQR0_NEOCL|nr:conserved hypothetical protein [Neospora caninum Liverpool]CBZ56057.1 conserved hypothetical protein [Neospora caninum Liverpool]|eukprot:XP_003886083.1 conserved hypothetical protein [Neospora caninum Liverpool]
METRCLDDICQAHPSVFFITESHQSSMRVGLDSYYGYDMDLMKQDSLQRQLSDPASSTNLGRSGVTAEEEAFAKKHGEKRHVSQGILAEPPQFIRNSRGVVVRSGGRQGDDFTSIKLADLRTAYALSLLENDMNHYRHLYCESRRKSQVEGRLKFFVVPSGNIVVPDLWLDDHSTIVENIPPPPPKELQIHRELAMLPDLQQAFLQLRKRQMDMMPARRKTEAAPAAPPAPPANATQGKVPPSALPGKGAVAALKASQVQKVSEASKPPPVRPTAPEVTAKGTADGAQPPAKAPPEGMAGSKAEPPAGAKKAKGPPPGKLGKGPPLAKSKLPPPKK